MVLTIIIPVYNEEENIERIAQSFSNYFASKCSVLAQVLFVDDGSSDNSLKLITALHNTDSRFQYIAFTENRGLSAAIKAGIDHIDTELTGYIDADLQTSPEDFELLLSHIKDYAAVVGYRAKRKDTFSKRIQSKIANSFRRMLINDGIIDTGCPLKIIRTDAAKNIPFFKGMHRFIPALIQLQGKKVHQVAVQHFERQAGKSKFNLLNRSIGPFTDAFVYRWMKRRYINYKIKEKS